MITRHILFSLLIVIFTINKDVEALKCYACSIPNIDPGEEISIDLSCINDVRNMTGNIINCPPAMKFCYIVRQDYSASNSPSSFVRQCVEKPSMDNDEIDDGQFITYYRSCQKDLCNYGDGKQYNNVDDGDQITGQMIPGKSAAFEISAFHILLLSLFSCLFTIL